MQVIQHKLVGQEHQFKWEISRNASCAMLDMEVMLWSHIGYGFIYGSIVMCYCVKWAHPSSSGTQRRPSNSCALSIPSKTWWSSCNDLPWLLDADLSHVLCRCMVCVGVGVCVCFTVQQVEKRRRVCCLDSVCLHLLSAAYRVIYRSARTLKCRNITCVTF